MRKTIIAAFFSVCTFSAYAQQAPNIIYILVDDMGYGDLGVLFQNQRKLSGNRSLP